MLRALAHAGRAGALVTIFAGAIVTAVSLHAHTAAFRSVAERIGNRATASLFEGKIVVTGLTSLSVGRYGSLHARRVEVTDAAGARVILAEDVESSIDLYRLLSSIAKGHAPVVSIRKTRIGRADVVLDLAADGATTIAHAFRSPSSSATPGSPSTTPPLESPSEPYVDLASVEIAHAHVHGNIAPPELDGTADGLVARVRVEHHTARISLDGGDVTLDSPRAPNQRSPVVGSAKGSLDVDFRTARLRGNVDLDASTGGAPLTVHAWMDGEQVEATVDVAETSPVILGTAFSDLPVNQPIELHARAHGTLPTLQIDVQARVGDAAMMANTEFDLREGHAFKVDVDVAHVDANAFGAGTTTDLSGRMHGEGFLGHGPPIGTFRVTTADGTIATEKIPPAIIEGRFENGRLTATVRASKPGVQANGNVEFDIASKTATFDLQARASSLRELPHASSVVSGSASARVQGHVGLESRMIDARFSANGDGISADMLSAKHLRASGTIAGPIAAPVIDVGFSGSDVRLEAEKKSPLVYPAASGHAKIALAPTPHVIEAAMTIDASGAAGEVTATVQGVTIASGAIEARGLRITGLGEPLELDATVGRGKWRIRAKSAGIDLQRAAAITGIKELALSPQDTRATVDVDLRQGEAGAEGSFDVVVRSDKGFGDGAIVAEAHARLDKGKLVGTSNVTAEGLGQVEITRAELDVPRQLDPASLKRVTGAVELRGTIDLSRVAPLFVTEDVERVAGAASFDARIERNDPTSLPVVRATARTAGLEVAFAESNSTKPFVATGIDVQSHVAWDGRTNDTEISILSWDAHGLLGSAGAKARLPIVDWATGVAKFDPNAIAALDVGIVADVPSRELTNLPEFLEAPNLRGHVDAHLRVNGTVGHPKVVVSGRARGLRMGRPRGAGTSLEPLDGAIEANWDGERATITFGLDERRRVSKHRLRAPPTRGVGTEVLLSPSRTEPSRSPEKIPGHIRGLVLFSNVRAADLLRGRTPNELPWTASAEVEAENVSLGGLPGLTAMTGSLSGRARLKELNRNPSFEANAHVTGLGTGGATVESVDLTMFGRDASLFAHAAMTDNQSRGTIQLTSQALRVTGLDVSFHPEAPTRLDYAVQNGRLALVGPLVRKDISEIDGRVDGTGSITITPNEEVFEGGLAVHEARLYVNALGEEIGNLAATIRFDRTGTFRIDEASGKVGTGEFRASASGRMKGLQFMGAQATLIATKDGIPLSSEAVTFAEAAGEVNVDARMSDDRKALLVTVDVPRANVQLPDRNTQSLQSLEPDPTVAVGIRKTNGRLDTAAVRKNRGGTGGTKTTATTTDPLMKRLTVSLGNDVRLAGRGLDIKLGGRTLVELADELSVTGRIDLRGGTIEVHGRRFNVDRGVVTFPEGGDPSNPTIVAAAYWDAPDRTRVWVEFAGPLKTGSLTLRSEPAFSKNEILSVLLFGRPDPNMATGGGTGDKTGDASGATAIGTGFVAGDLNRMLSDIDKDLDVETDTLSGNRTRGKVGRSFFDRRLKVQIGYAPGRTYREPDNTFFFLNWQFIPKWSLVGTGGNRGTSIVDVLFQHRY